MNVTDTTCFFDADGESGNWIAMVRSVCDSGRFGDWSDTVWFNTPVCIGINMSDVAEEITLIPNPTDGRAVLSFGSSVGQFDVTVVDLSGRVVMTHVVVCTDIAAVPFIIEGLDSGTYLVRVSSRHLNVVRKLIVR